MWFKERSWQDPGAEEEAQAEPLWTAGSDLVSEHSTRVVTLQHCGMASRNQASSVHIALGSLAETILVLSAGGREAWALVLTDMQGRHWPKQEGVRVEL